MKKALSLLIVLCMLISLVPMVSAATPDAGNITISYDLQRAVDAERAACAAANGGTYADGTMGGNLHSDRFKYAANNGFFEVSTETENPTSPYNDTRIILFRDYALLRSNAQWVAIKVQVPVAGTYDLHMWNAMRSTAPHTVEVYVKKDSRPPFAATGADNEYYVGSYSTQSSDANWTIPTNPNVVPGLEFPEAGEWVITFRPVNPAGNDTSSYATIGNFALVSGDGSGYALMGTFNAPEAMEVGEKGTVSATAKKSNDPNGDAVALKYYSTASNIVSVDETTGAIEAKAAGSATVYASADGTMTNFAKTITVTEPVKPGITINYNFGYLMKANNAATSTNIKNITTYDATNGFYKVLGASAETIAGNSVSYTSTSGDQTFVALGCSNGQEGYSFVSFEVDVPVADTYKLLADYLVASNGVYADVYLTTPDKYAKPTVAGGGSSGYNYSYYNGEFGTKLGTIDTKNGSGISTGEVSGIAIPKAGKYVITFVSLRDNRPNTDVAQMGNFKLVSGDGSGAAVVGTISDPATVKVGEQTTVSAAGKWSNAPSGADVSLKYYSEAPEIVSVDESTGLATANKPGSAIIYTMANGKRTNLETKITAVKEGITINYNFGDWLFANGFNVTGGSGNIPGYGKTVMDCTPESAGYLYSVKTASRTLSIGAWSFYATSDGKHINLGTASGTLPGDTDRTLMYNFISFEVNVPTADTYKLTAQTYKYSSGVYMDVYVASAADYTRPPINSDLDGFVTYEGLGTLAGTIDTRGDAGFTTDEVENINIPSAGKYVITFASRRDTRGGDCAAIGNFKLISGDGTKTALVTAVPNATALENLEVGDTYQLEVTGYMSDATSKALTASGFESSEQGVATVSSTGLIEVKGYGTTTITYSAEGIALSTTVTVENPAAVDPEAPAKVQIYAQAKNGEDAVAGAITGIDVDKWVAFDAGDTVTLTAAETVGALKFVSWKNNAGVVVSSSATYTFKAGSNEKFTAEYTAATAGDTVKVTFYNPNGEIVAVKTVDKGTTFGDVIAEVGTPSMIGGQFVCWTSDGEEITNTNVALAADQHLVAKYTALSAGAITGGSNADGSYNYNDKVSASTELDGFTHWKKNGNVVSFDKAYTFFAWAAATLEASAEEVVVKPFAVLDPETKGEAVMAEYNALTATKIEAGIIFGDSADITLADYNSKAVSKSASKSGQFAAKRYNSADTYARAYLIYNDGTGAKVAYSAAVAY